jgi:hypothetical protein
MKTGDGKNTYGKIDFNEISMMLHENIGRWVQVKN